MAGEIDTAFEKFKALGKDKLRELDDALAFLTKAQMQTPAGAANRELLKKSGVDPSALKTLAAYRAYKFKSKTPDVSAFDSLAPPTDENGRPANPALRTDVRYEQKPPAFVGPPANMAPPIDRTAEIFGVTDPLDSGEPDVSPPTDEHGNPANPELAIDTFYETPTDEDGFRANKELRTDVRYGANPAHERMLGQVLSAAQEEERRKQQQQLPAAGLPLALALRGGL